MRMIYYEFWFKEKQSLDKEEFVYHSLQSIVCANVSSEFLFFEKDEH